MRPYRVKGSKRTWGLPRRLISELRPRGRPLAAGVYFFSGHRSPAARFHGLYCAARVADGLPPIGPALPALSLTSRTKTLPGLLIPLGRVFRPPNPLLSHVSYLLLKEGASRFKAHLAPWSRVGGGAPQVPTGAPTLIRA